jgi:hypothetical protein
MQQASVSISFRLQVACGGGTSRTGGVQNRDHARGRRGRHGGPVFCCCAVGTGAVPAGLPRQKGGIVRVAVVGAACTAACGRCDAAVACACPLVRRPGRARCCHATCSSLCSALETLAVAPLSSWNCSLACPSAPRVAPSPAVVGCHRAARVSRCVARVCGGLCGCSGDCVGVRFSACVPL